MEPIKISLLIHVLVKFCVWRYVGEVIHTCSTDVRSLDSLDFKTQAGQTISPTMSPQAAPQASCTMQVQLDGCEQLQPCQATLKKSEFDSPT